MSMISTNLLLGYLLRNSSFYIRNPSNLQDFEIQNPNIKHKMNKMFYSLFG